MGKEKRDLRRLTNAAMMSALVCIATLVIPIPIPGGGYANAGDIVLLVTAFVLSPGLAALASGFGAAVADIILGYSMYVPGTLVIKALAALAAGLMIRWTRKHMKLVPAIIVAGICGELVMIAGYYGYEYAILENAVAAAAGAIPNIIQGLAGIAGAAVLTPLMERILKTKKRIED